MKLKTNYAVIFVSVVILLNKEEKDTHGSSHFMIWIEARAV